MIGSDDSADLGITNMIRILDRRRILFAVTTSTVLSVAILICLFATRKYTANGVLQIQKSASDSLGLDSLMGGGGEGAGDSLSLNVDLQTQADILQSETLAIRAIKELNLENDADFQYHFNPLGWTLGLLSPRGTQDPKGASLEDAPARLKHTLDIFSANLKVQVTAGTRLLKISYTSHDPKIAAAVVNELMQSLNDFSFQTRFSATTEVSQWLEKQLGDLRKQNETLQARAVALQQGSDVFGLGGVDQQGKTILYSPVLDKLQQSTGELAQAQMNRILKQSVFEVTKSVNPDLISQLSGTSLIAASPGVADSLALIQQLRGQEATLQAQVQQDASQFGPSYYRLVEERASLKSVQDNIRLEVNRIYVRARNDYEIALQTEVGLRGKYDSNRKDAQALNVKSIEYQIVSREAEQSEALYQDLLKRLREAGILESLKSSNVTVVDHAHLPAKPSKPRPILYLPLGLLAGVMLGFITAIFVDAIDNKVQSTEQIESINIPSLGITPKIVSERPTGAPLPSEPHSIFNEAIRAVRSTLLMSRTGSPPQLILVTSAAPAEGKSTIALSLAGSLAQVDKKVLLVEADLRRPVLKGRLGLEGTPVGLSQLLAGQHPDYKIPSLANFPNLYVLPGGPIPPFPAEMLASQQMQMLVSKWRSEFDFILLDSPPVLPVADSHLLQESVDATVLVARAGKTTMIALRRAYRLLNQHSRVLENPNIGVLLNMVNPGSAGYYGYYGYYGGSKYEYQARNDA